MRRIILAALMIPGLVACSDDDPAGIALEFSPLSGTAMSNGLVLTSGFEVNRLEALVREVKVLPGKDNDDASKFKDKGTFFVDALDADKNTIPTFELTAGNYKKVEFKFEKDGGDTGIDELDIALLLDATVAGTIVEVRVSKMDKVTLRDVDGITLADGVTGTFLIDLDVPSWFTGVDLTALDADSDGVVIIDDSGVNKSVYKDVTDNIKAAIKVLRKPSK